MYDAGALLCQKCTKISSLVCIIHDIQPLQCAYEMWLHQRMYILYLHRLPIICTTNNSQNNKTLNKRGQQLNIIKNGNTKVGNFYMTFFKWKVFRQIYFSKAPLTPNLLLFDTNNYYIATTIQEIYSIKFVFFTAYSSEMLNWNT